jgi:hypothetical protein
MSFRPWSHEKSQTLLTGLLVLIGCAYTVAAIFQWLSMREQARGMGEQLKVMSAEVENTKSARSADFIFKLDERFSKEPIPRIKYAIQNDKPVLKEHGGEFTEDDLDGYLDLYETMNDIYAKGLVSQDMLVSAYSFWLGKAYHNAEIQDYLVRIRKEDPRFYSGFEQLFYSMSSEATLSKKP